jgi:hypothetical protein
VLAYSTGACFYLNPQPQESSFEIVGDSTGILRLARDSLRLVLFELNRFGEVYW